MMISDCVWSLSETSISSGSNLFLLSGTFECDKMKINSYPKTNIRFLRTNSGVLNFSKFIFEDIATGLTNYHFGFVNGESTFLNSV